jgi:hypothetical protein
MGLLGWLLGGRNDEGAEFVHNAKRYQAYEEIRADAGQSHVHIDSSQWFVAEDGVREVRIGKQEFDIFGNHNS